MKDLIDGAKIAHEAGCACGDAIRAQLVPGAYAKIHVMRERFWTQIVAIEGSVIVARVANDLQMTDQHGLVCDEIVRYLPTQVFAVLAENAV